MTATMYLAKGFYYLCLICGISIAVFVITCIILLSVFLYVINKDIKKIEKENDYER